jgi:hypothetical protein
MQQLNLPPYTFKTKDTEGRKLIFDNIRKKYVSLTPEEWVRQNFLQFLIKEKKYPASLIAVEIGLKYNNLQKRADIVIYNKQGAAQVIVECKSTSVKISQETFYQIANYNMAFKVAYLILTNGLTHYCCKMNYTDNSFEYLETIPNFD